MSKQMGNVLSIICTAVVVSFTMSASAQIKPLNHVYALASSVSTNSESTVPHNPQPDKPVAVAPTDNTGAIEIEIVPKNAATTPVTKTMPSTLTVRTAALLELHAMRQNAVDLCLQLPTKYRTRLPQCADIFKHEIRLKALAKEQQEKDQQEKERQ